MAIVMAVHSGPVSWLQNQVLDCEGFLVWLTSKCTQLEHFDHGVWRFKTSPSGQMFSLQNLERKKEK